MFKRNAKKPQWMITYWCPRCEFDSSRTELDGPYCYYCDRKDGLTEMEREPMSPQAIAKRLTVSSERMMDDVRKAHDISADEWPDDEEQELMLLEALAKGQNLKEKLQKMAKKMSNAK